MIVYLAARFPRREELRQHRDDLLAHGIKVASHWIDLPHDGGVQADAARVDVGDLLSADVLISFTESDPAAPGAGRGGRHAEFGIAAGVGLMARDYRTNYRRRRFRLFVVGPREHVFHHLETVEQFDTWAEALAALTEKGTTT